MSVTQFDDAIVEFEVHATEIEQWTQPAGRRNVRQLKRVFVSFWMSDPQTPGLLPELVRKGLLGKAEVITGKGLHGSPQWSPEIRTLIRGADVVVLDLTAPRREVFVEWGWAIGAQKPVILCAKDRNARCSNPRWVQERQVKPYETEGQLAELLASILHCLDSPQDRVQRWVDDPDGKSMNYRPKVKIVGMVGRSEMLPRLESLCESACKENGFEFTSCLGAEVEEGGRLFRVIPLARKAATLVLLFDGTDESDLLTCVAGGVFTTQDDISTGNKKIPRKLILVAPQALSNQILPGLLSTKPWVAAERNADNVTRALRTQLDHLNQKINDVRTGITQ